MNVFLIYYDQKKIIDKMDCNSLKVIIMLYIYTCVCQRFDGAYMNNAVNVNMTNQSEVSLQGMW